MPRLADGRQAAGSTRTTPRLLLILAAVFLAARLVLAFVEKPAQPAAEGRGGRSEGAADLVHWVGPDSAEMLASQSGKPILYDFMAAWCGPCKIMKAEIFADTASASFINSTFVPARVIDRAVEDGRNVPAVEALQKKYDVHAFPTLIVARPGRDPVVLEGYGGKDETLKQLRDAAAPR
jgi:thioredoxin 1